LLPAEAELQVGLLAYEKGNYQLALKAFQNAVRLNAPPILVALSGEFMCLRKLGKEKRANQAFHLLLANSIKQRQRVDFRLLFKVGSPYFLENKVLVTRYAWRLRHLACYVKESGTCLEIIGHCSHTGNEKYNDRLSLQRAKLVQGIMAVTYPGIKQKTKVIGMGWRENIVGTGTDNVTDAIDRRVEFKVVDCVR
jgi:outer membrane protein OmpA-like peptidoglycan-associated protein